MIEFDLVTFTVAEPRHTAQFWTAALCLSIIEDEDEGRWVVLAAADGARRIGLQRGTPSPNGAHLDLRCAPATFHEALDRLVALGAAVIQGSPRVEPYGWIANLHDPSGLAFDLCAYQARNGGATP